MARPYKPSLFKRPYHDRGEASVFEPEIVYSPQPERFAATYDNCVTCYPKAIIAARKLLVLAEIRPVLINESRIETLLGETVVCNHTIVIPDKIAV